MVKVTNSFAEKKLTVEEIFDCDINTCILEDWRIAFCGWMGANLFDKVNEKDFSSASLLTMTEKPILNTFVLIPLQFLVMLKLR